MTDAPHSPDASAADLADLAERLALVAADLAMTMAAEARADLDTKSSATDLVTAADRAAEAAIVEGILAARPNDAIEGEEGTSRPGTSNVTWHIDPIDGTTNYVYALPAFSVSVAAAVDDEVVAGIVVDPTHEIVYRAVQGDGATANGSPLRCSSLDTMATALVATGFSYRSDRRREQAQVMVELLPAIRDIRRHGSAALELCAVATGQVDAYYESGLNRWDLAAGSLIASEAGALVANLDDGPPDGSAALAAGPGVFGPLRDALRAIDGAAER